MPVKRIGLIPIDSHLKVGYMAFMLVVPTQDVILYPGRGKTLEYESLGLTTVVGDRLQLIGRDR